MTCNFGAENDFIIFDVKRSVIHFLHQNACHMTLSKIYSTLLNSVYVVPPTSVIIIYIIAQTFVQSNSRSADYSVRTYRIHTTTVSVVKNDLILFKVKNDELVLVIKNSCHMAY